MASPEHLQGIPTEKSRLQEYAQRACAQLPVYQTLNEGPPHALQFRSQVLVDGIWYTSPNTFSSRKVAEHDAAKHAFIGLREKLKAEGRSLILEDLHFCKAILNEYAVKMNMKIPTYVTNESKAHVPIFVSSLQLNGVTFSGDAARTKKEAEQLAARSAILSILVSEAGTTMSVIVKSKFKFHNALKLAKDSCIIRASPVMDSSIIWASPVMDSSSIQASPIMDSSSIQASPVMESSNIPNCDVNKFSSNVPECFTKDPSITPTCITKDTSVMPACIVKASPSIPACIIKNPASTQACMVENPVNTQACMVENPVNTQACMVENPVNTQACMVENPVNTQACIIKDSPNIHLGPVATEVAPLDSALVSFTSTKEVDIGVCAIKDMLATIQQPSFAPFPSIQLAHSESASEQPSRSQSTHQSLHLFKKPKLISSVEAVTPPIIFVPPTIEQASESPVCSTSGKKRRRNKKTRKNLLHQSPSTIVMVTQNQVPAFPVTTQQNGHSISLQGFVA
ncbi:uncharacterized protein [Primulina eburnea]|uniref:uncharacterized protein isoform X1 n=1 Tax=Primulina eburnea TaxID=1245227 RepID=UPI003C6C0AAE